MLLFTLNVIYNYQKTQRITTMEKKLYSWQEDCLKRWFANKGRGMVQAVTGSGKTLLALTAADRWPNNPSGTAHQDCCPNTNTYASVVSCHKSLLR